MENSQFKSQKAHQKFLKFYDEAMEKLPVPQGTFDINTAYGNVRVYRFGNRGGIPILLFPGRAASTPMWEPNLTGLLKTHDVYAMDLLGEPGLSIQTHPIKDNKQQASWVEEVIMKLKLTKVHLLGVSFGGWSVVNYAVNYPKCIASIILLDPALVFAPFSLKIILFSLITTLPFIPEKWREKSMSWISGGAEIDSQNSTSILISIGLKEFTIKTPPPKQFTAEELNSIHPPVLVIFAGKSIVHNSVKALVCAKNLSNHVEAEVWPAASHAINGEFPDQINERISQFLSGLGM
ncbi:alpha/beta fold hydrolase [Chryseobacterium sp. W4I1]|uniref:alpha/beta fold hydrolase n=1 Tax=Chryseobacterium sp. W4I1 TaxID=3042293 RepID=UPI00277F722D|nr:alpha/beta hydrolase [Chryseobacterium sp. W4I1]MDQ0782367.1 pimeloyl-ACP methyl ester carboxylesterase [Chryseobacterium sp. W4I1]